MKNWVIALLITFPAFTVSSATLSMQNGVELLALNGKKTESKNNPIALRDGKNQIVIRVYKEFSKGSNSDLFSSSPYILTFDEQGADIVVALPGRINDYRKVEKEFRSKDKQHFELKMGASNLQYTSDPLRGNGGFIPYSNLEELIAIYNQDNGIAVSREAVVDLQEAAVTVQENGEVEITGDSITQLKLWYTKATKEERKTFRKWMIDQE
ncbi:DUF2057 domain-containing protein [Enterovibrio baiacu]|uniref:YccT family protein n=1 Tax=Enterovibrio baiacu TaxID=2491023 RepID=UPI0010117369|nr:DUF2057 domain-containing protein [Enterovibrio baiacu]MBE1274842.1 DUF2057 domain-containing protein [Enterovibrio baiacu]